MDGEGVSPEKAEVCLKHCHHSGYKVQCHGRTPGQRAWALHFMMEGASGTFTLGFICLKWHFQQGSKYSM